MTERQRELIDRVIVTLDSLTITGAGNMGKVLGCINALNEVLEVEDNGGQTNQGA